MQILGLARRGQVEKSGERIGRDKEEKRYNKTVNNTRSPSEINQMVKLRYCKGDSQLGHPRAGFNWYWEDSFVCPRCRMYLFVLWEILSSNDEDELECPKCHHRFLVTCSLNELLNGILIGAPYPGLNIGNENIFRCPACLNYIREKDVKLPMEGICDHCYSEWKFYPHRLREEIERGKIDSL